MAVVKPFRGVRYNPARFDDLSLVVAQPYDRITPELAEQYLGLCPYNISDIIIGQEHSDGLSGGSTTPGNVYTHARDDFETWLAEGILIREETPAVYAYEQTFVINGQQYVRLGMIAAVGLAEFDEGIILPHERTHSAPKADRLELLQTMQVNTEQIFVLYPDPDNHVNSLLHEAIGDRAPDIDVVEQYENQVRQRVWIVTDPATLDAIQAHMAPLRGLIIADGHHRYETALNYRRQQYAINPDIPANAALNFAGVTLVSMDDPGLVVLPTHREIRNFSDRTPAEVLDRAGELFTVASTPNLETTLAAVKAAPNGHVFGFYGGPEVGFHTLTPRSDTALLARIVDDRSNDWKALAVSVLHGILLEQIAGVPAQGIDDKTMVRYHRDPQIAVDSVNAGQGNFVFFLSPTSIEQIKAVASQGEKMPQKSTDFYPKMISGITMLPVGPGECLGDDQPLVQDAALHPGD